MTAFQPTDACGVLIASNIHGEELRSFENPNVPLNDPDAWNEAYGITASKSGVAVTPSTALTYSPVWQAVNLISGDVAKLPLNVYRRLEDNGREVDQSHPAQPLIRKRANQEPMHALKFWRRLMVHALIWNNAYAWIIRNGAGEPVELVPLLPDRTHPVGSGYATEVKGDIKGLAARDVLHIEGISVEGRGDCELVTKARDSWGRGMAAVNLESRYYANGGRKGGILELPSSMPKKARDRVEAGFRKSYEDPNKAFRTVVLREGAKFHDAQFGRGDLEATEASKEHVRDVARWYNLPPHKLGDDTRVSHNSLEEENQSYLDGCLDHWLQTIQAECEMKLLRSAEDRTHFVEHNTAALLRTDIKTRYEVYNLGRNMGMLTPNDCLKMENMNPRTDTGGDEYLRPLNMGVSNGETDEMPVEEDQDRSVSPAVTAASMRSLVDASSHAWGRFLAKVHRQAGKKGKPQFVRWWQDDLPAEVSRLVDELEVPAGPMAVIAGRTGRQLAESVVNRATAQLFEQVEGRFGDTPPEAMAIMLAEACDELKNTPAAVIQDLAQGTNDD